jgi:hypothetical protein
MLLSDAGARGRGVPPTGRQRVRTDCLVATDNLNGRTFLIRRCRIIDGERAGTRAGGAVECRRRAECLQLND